MATKFSGVRHPPSFKTLPHTTLHSLDQLFSWHNSTVHLPQLLHSSPALCFFVSGGKNKLVYKKRSSTYHLPHSTSSSSEKAGAFGLFPTKSLLPLMQSRTVWFLIEAQAGLVFSLDFDTEDKLGVLSSRCFLNRKDVNNHAWFPFLRVLETTDKVLQGAHRIVRCL